MSEDNILYEIKENIAEIKQSLLSIVENTDLKFQLKQKEIELLKRDLKVANNRILDLENNQKWFVCAIIGGFLTLLFSLFK